MLFLGFVSTAAAKEIALTFDDAPMASSGHFETHERTAELIRKLAKVKVPSVMIFANPCKKERAEDVMRQLRSYRDAGHMIGNHTCSHPRLDDVGYFQYAADTERADRLLLPLFVEHLTGAVAFYDDLAVKTLGYSPKHVMLLHEMDVTVMFLDSVVTALREKGWKIIGVEEAFSDPLYLARPRSTYANNGIVAQLEMDKTGRRVWYDQSQKIRGELDRILDLNSPAH
ncbi:MAG: polysaccharide deacetylase family protein [Calothrix sp. SM1_5_4]|nr:polysaccharide deacetylase family protein [Calothrix sp. SM1_5_4]